MLMAARTSEVRLATFDEIEGDIWTLAPERTKAGVEHRVPLSAEALEIVAQAKHANETPHLFPSYRGKPMSDAAMSAFMRRGGYNAKPHGFRATFRTWAEEVADAPHEVKEACLGHVVDGGVVRAYQRSDRFTLRKKLMRSWSDFLRD